VTVRLQTLEWDRHRRGLSYLLEGYDRENGTLLATLAWGELHDVAEINGVYEASHTVKVPPEVNAVKLTFTLWDTTHRVPGLPLEPGPGKNGWRRPAGAVVMGRDAVWKTD
jgi:hypothetical protein